MTRDETKKLHKVRVRLVAETEVEIEVWCSDDEEPCDLTDEEKAEAISKGGAFPRWEVESVEEA